MACYSPLLAQKILESDPISDLYHYGKVRRQGIKIIGKVGQVHFDDELTKEGIKNGSILTLPCGKCIGCKLDYARHWADRMMLEYEACKKAVFVTLTYEDHDLPDVNPETGEKFNIKEDLNDEGAPISPLIKKHVSEFIKSLRSKFMDNGRQDIRLRFFACGEYGEKRHRPHYHVILFGCDLEDLRICFRNAVQGDLEPWVRNELGQVSFRSNFLESVWKERGIVTVSDVSYQTMSYVGRYSLKKAQGSSYPKDHYLPEEFTLMSRRPGIGVPFLEKYPGKLKEVSSWYVAGKEIRWPSYLLKKEYTLKNSIEVLDPQDPIHYYEGELDPRWIVVSDKRQKSCVDAFMNTFEFDERPYYEKQEFLQRQKQASAKKLKRGDVALA